MAIIENASADDADIAASLTLIAFKDFSYYTFGENDDEKVLDIYSKLWWLEDIRFRVVNSFEDDTSPLINRTEC